MKQLWLINTNGLRQLKTNQPQTECMWYTAMIFAAKADGTDTSWPQPFAGLAVLAAELSRTWDGYLWSSALQLKVKDITETS